MRKRLAVRNRSPLNQNGLTYQFSDIQPKDPFFQRNGLRSFSMQRGVTESPFCRSLNFVWLSCINIG